MNTKPCNPWPDSSIDVGGVRRLLAKSARIRRPRVVLGVTNGRVRAIISQALAGRPSHGPVSPFVADVARRLAGVG